MSASREKKARQERGADYLSPKQQKALEEQKAARRSTLIFTVCAALFVLCVAAMFVWNSGVIQRGAGAVRINGETYTAADVSFYYYNTRSNIFNSVSPGMDPGGSMRKQEYAEGQSWFDLIADRAIQSMTGTVLAAQAGKDAGLDLTEDYQNHVSEALAALDEYAASSGYSTSQYLKGAYSSLMTPDVYERNLRTVALAEVYSDSISAVSNYSDAELTAKRDAEPEKYDAVAVRHILVEDEDTAKDLLARWESGERTEDSFAALAGENSTDPGSVDNGGLYTDVTEGQMVTEFNDWCFDDARRPGDTGIVETSYGYHVMYFVSRGLSSTWQETAAAAIAADRFAALSEGVEAERLSGMSYVDR